jgi:hypothetical protein
LKRRFQAFFFFFFLENHGRVLEGRKKKKKNHGHVLEEKKKKKKAEVFKKIKIKRPKSSLEETIL